MSQTVAAAKSIYAGHPNGKLLRLNQFEFDKMRIKVGPEIHTGERWKGETPQVAKLRECYRTGGGIARADIVMPEFAPPAYLEQIDTGAKPCKFGTPRWGKIKLRLPDLRVNMPHGGRRSEYPEDLDRTGYEVVRIHAVERVIMSDSGGVFWETDA
jgi:hypothetical protein